MIFSTTSLLTTSYVVTMTSDKSLNMAAETVFSPASDAGTDSQSVSARRANNRYSLSPVGYQYDTPQTANNIFLIKQIR